MKRNAVVLLLSLLSFSVVASELENKALQGDYQSQRNLAYGYATGGSQKKDVELACAWYLLIVRSDSARINIGDISNISTYCDKLDFDKRLLAEKKANSLYKQIYRR